MNSSTKYLKLALLNLLTYALGVGLFYLTVFQLAHLIFPGLSAWWVLLAVPVVSIVTTYAAEAVFSSEELSQTYVGDLFVTVADQAVERMYFLGISSPAKDVYLGILALSSLWYFLIEGIVRIPFWLFFLPIKWLFRKP